MSTNGLNTTEDTDMAELADDGEKVVTMMDVLQEQQDFDDDANAVLGASDDKDCTYAKGYIKRQAIYACLTCCTEAKTDPLKRAGVCLACSLNCHENHELVELYTKRNFRCDCGNPKFSTHPCQYTTNKTDLNKDNNYNQNFTGLYCTCHRPYPDPEATEEDEMIQCIICEDWLHASHLEATVPVQDQYSEMICKGCMEKNDFLHDYSNFAVNVETADVDIVTVNGLDANESEKVCKGETEENKLLNGKTVVVADTHNEKETKIHSDIQMTEEKRKETDSSGSLEENKAEKILQTKGAVKNEQESSQSLEENKEEEIVKNEQETKAPMEDDNSGEVVSETEDKEGSNVVSSKEEVVKVKVEFTEECTNVPKEVDVAMKIAAKTGEEIAELEMEKALLDSPTPDENPKNVQGTESVTESEKDKTTDVTEKIVSNTTDNKSPKIIPQNYEPERDDEKVVDETVTETEKHGSDKVTVQSSTDKKMDGDVIEEQTTATPSVEKKDAVEEKSVSDDSVASNEDPAKETDNISKSTNNIEINEIKSISTSETCKPDEQSQEPLITENVESPVVSEDKPNITNEPEQQITEDTVKDQIETMESIGDATKEDVIKVSIDESTTKSEECDITKADSQAKPAEEEINDRKEEESSVNTETKSTDIDMDAEAAKTVIADTENKELDNKSDSANENKRKLSTEVLEDDVSVKKVKIDELKKCVRPCGVKKVHKGATFWPSNFRQKLCTCNECLSMYKDLSVLFLIDPDDTVSAYEMLGQERINGGPATQYERGLEALSSLDRIQQINALTEYNKMRDKLLDFLKSFKDRKEIVREEDIKAFFAGMKPKREPDGVYFCR